MAQGSNENSMNLGLRNITWALALLSACFVLLLALRTHTTIERLETSQQERAWMLAHALAATVQGVARHGPDATERTQAVFDELVESGLVSSATLIDQTGQSVVQGGGSLADSPSWVGGLERRVSVSDAGMELLLPFELQAGHGMGQGMRSRRSEGSLGSGSYALQLVLDTSTASGVRAHILGSDLALLVIGLGLAVLGSLLLRSQVHNHQLRERVALQEQRRKSLESLRLLAAGLAHETKNPLGAIRGNTQLLMEASDDDESRGRAAMILEQIDQVTDRLNEFLSFARQRKPRWEPVDLSGVAGTVVELLSPDAKAAGVTLALREDPHAELQGDGRQLQELLFNLVLNALQACGAGDEVRVTISADEGSVSVEVADTGPGIAPADMERITEPYFTTRQAGSGLGLSIVERIAESHHAKLSMVSTEGEGSRFGLTFHREPPRDD